MDKDFRQDMVAFWQPLEAFVEHLESQVQERWRFWATNHEQRHVHEVIGGLLARQATLASQLAMNPLTWNEHSAPLFLRPMVENCITTAWILGDENERDNRAKQFIEYGLGQENLLLKHAKANIQEQRLDPEDDPAIKQWEEWTNSQKYTFLTEVNVGNWADKNLREMAEQVELIDLHTWDFALASGAVHSTWNHLVKYDLRDCSNPLHGHHRIPYAQPLGADTEFLGKAAGYVDATNSVFDRATGYELGDPTTLQVLDELLKGMVWPEQRHDAPSESDLGS